MFAPLLLLLLTLPVTLPNRRALEIKPLQPELRNIMGEAASLAHDFDAMKAVLGKNTDIVDNLAEKGLASLSLASMYHKIGHCFIKVRHALIFLTFFLYFNHSEYFILFPLLFILLLLLIT